MTRDHSGRVADLAAKAGVLGIQGENGAGKTSIAVQVALAYVEAGGAALSTVAIDHPSVELITGWPQILDARYKLLLLDDIEVVASNRDTMTLNHSARVFFATLRHRHVKVVWTASDWADVDVKIRRRTQRMLTVSPAFFGRGPVDVESGWPTTKTARVKAYRVTRSGRDPMPDLKSALSSVRVSLAGLPSRGRFDTFADLEELPASGDCSVCGLPKRRQFCGCRS